MSRWKILKSDVLFKAGFFRARVDQCELPDGRVMPRYYVFEFPDWVNVIPVTPSGELVLVRQHRHGAEQEFLEVPGGSTHPGAQEDPRLAGERELLEETGYRGAEWIACGAHYPNPALQGNRMHTFIALGCELVAKPELDPFEDLTVELMPLEKAYALLDDGGFTHSIIAASLSLARKTLRARGMLR
jgi:8-oxo-dGTP pyrophosphatase MutT (NUDIX family)